MKYQGQLKNKLIIIIIILLILSILLSFSFIISNGPEMKYNNNISKTKIIITNGDNGTDIIILTITIFYIQDNIGA